MRPISDSQPNIDIEIISTISILSGKRHHEIIKDVSDSRHAGDSILAKLSE